MYDTFQQANNNGTDQTAQMHVVSKPPKTGFLVPRPITSSLEVIKLFSNTTQLITNGDSLALKLSVVIFILLIPSRINFILI